MQSDRDGALRDVEARLASKDREWKELHAVRAQLLEGFLTKTQEECSSLREHYQKLREDFHFNLAVLDERDRELERYDVLTARALTVEHNRQAELNQLHVQISKLEEQRARGAEERQEELRKHDLRAVQQRLQLDELKRSMAGEIQKQMKECDRVKLDLQRRIKDAEEELTCQRQEMLATFDSELRQREHEFNQKMDEMRAVVLSHEVKVKLLSEETEAYCQAQLQASEALRTSKELCQQIQTQLQHKNQELKDITAMKDHRMKELEDELKGMETTVKEERSDHIKKYEEVVQALRACEAQLKAQHQAHTDQLQKAERHVVRLQEALAAQARRVQDQQEAMDQKHEAIQRLQTQVEATRTDWDEYIRQASSEMVVKDTGLIELQDRGTKLRTELQRSKEQTERYKQQLSAGLKRERALEQRAVQVELEWQRRCEDMKAEHYLANEQLILDLTQARDQARADLKEKEQEVLDVNVVLHSVRTERDQAMQSLTPTVDPLASEDMRRLQEQNSILRAVVTQMRKDMEGLNHVRLHPRDEPQASSPQPGPSAAGSSPMGIGPPAQSSGISSKVRPAGVGLGDHANTSAWTTLIGEAHPESALVSIQEQSALLRQLQEENLWWKQQASGLKSGGVFGKSHPPLLHTRLKQAASCIGRLSREKQQLIEMANRLRAQIATVRPQEPADPERDTPTEEQGEQRDRLSALEQLQYQLTTQELQYALKQKACTVAEQLLPGTNSRGPLTGRPAQTCQGHKTRAPCESSETKGDSPLLSQPQSQPHSGPSRAQLSSEGSLRSLKELWETLDDGLSLSMFSEGAGELSKKELTEPGGSGVQVMGRSHGPMYSQPPTKTSRPGAPGRTSNIRNYNVKD